MGLPHLPLLVWKPLPEGVGLLIIPPDPFLVLGEVGVPLLEWFSEDFVAGVWIEEGLAKEALPEEPVIGSGFSALGVSLVLEEGSWMLAGGWEPVLVFNSSAVGRYYFRNSSDLEVEAQINDSFTG